MIHKFAGLETQSKIVLTNYEQTPQVKAEAIKNVTGNWVLLFVGLEKWKREAWSKVVQDRMFDEFRPQLD